MYDKKEQRYFGWVRDNENFTTSEQPNSRGPIPTRKELSVSVFLLFHNINDSFKFISYGKVIIFMFFYVRF